jgi:adenylosuccinate synthase
VFSSFGSGTLQNAPTYWGPKCIIEPNSLIREYINLLNANLAPKLKIDPECPITMPYEIYINQYEDTDVNKTCGMGFGKTWLVKKLFSSIS